MPWNPAVVAAVVALAAALQAVSGFGFSLMAVPLLALAVGPKTAVVLAATIGPLLTWSIAFAERRHVLWRVAAALIVSAVAGMPVGLWIIEHVDPRVLEVIIAVAVMAMTALLALGFSASSRSSIDLLAGFVSGVLATSTSTNGPPLVFVLQAKGASPAQFRGTLSATFVVQGLVALTGFAMVGRIDAEIGRLFLVGLPGLASGFLLGARLRDRIDPRRFRTLVLALLLATGAFSLLQAILG